MRHRGQEMLPWGEPGAAKGAAPHCVVMASAGTGKTHRLSSRYIQLVASGAEPGTILATTFTRKAAGEILERVLKRLSAAAVGEMERVELSRGVGMELSRERCRELVCTLSRNLHRLNIGTIDSFLGRVLRGFALELGVSPAWSIIEDESDALAREEAVAAALSDPGFEADRLFTLLRMLSSGRLGPGVHSALLRAVEQAHGAYVSSREKPGAWEVFGPEGRAPDSGELAGIVRQLRGLTLPTSQKGERLVHWVRNIDKLCAALEGGHWKDVFEVTLVQHVRERLPLFASAEISDEASECIGRAVDAASVGVLAEFRDRNRAVRELMERIDAAYAALKSRRGILCFDDVPRLLTEAAGRIEEMYFRLDSRVHHLLLDEFQDTSLEQFEILKPMLDEMLSGGERSVLCVGDVKQSLYSWRGAEPELLPALRVRWPQFETDSLTKSWRSSPCVLKAVNAVFGGLTENPVLSEAGCVHRWKEGYEDHTTELADLPGRVRVVLGPKIEKAEDEEDEAPDVLTQKVEFIVERVKAIRDECPAASLGVLARRNTWIPRLIFELHKRGIDAAGDRGNPVTDTPATAAAVSMLQLADHPGDTAAFYHVTTSPVGAALGVKWANEPEVRKRDAVQLAARLRARITRGGIGGVLARIQRRIVTEMDALSYARFDQLIDLAREFDDTGGRPGEFVREARMRDVDPPAGGRRGDGAPTVRVMTTHKAKGLEFDAVVLVDMDKQWKVATDAVLVDRRDEVGRPDPLSGIGAVSLYPSKPIQDACPELRELFLRTRDRVISEELSGLYVGMTRARRCLEMIGFEEKEGGVPTAFKVVRAGLGAGGLRERGWERATGRPWFEGIEGAAARVRLGEGEVRFAPAKGVASGRMRSRSPSSLEKRTLGDLWRSGFGRGAEARDRGTAYHAMYESVEWLDDGKPTVDSLCAAMTRAGIAGDEAWAREIAAWCAGDGAGALWKKRYAGRPGALAVRREWRFAVREDDGLLTGQFDRVVVGMEGKRVLWAEVVDFKTDAVENGDEAGLAESVERYRPQVEAYKRAAAKLLRIEPAMVSGVLVFGGCGRMVEVA